VRVREVWSRENQVAGGGLRKTGEPTTTRGVGRLGDVEIQRYADWEGAGGSETVPGTIVRRGSVSDLVPFRGERRSKSTNGGWPGHRTPREPGEEGLYT